jgi:hypothetical protein
VIQWSNNLISTSEIEILMRDVDPRQNSVDMTYFSDNNIKTSCKKVRCDNHILVKKITDSLPFDTDSVSVAYYPKGSHNPLHADNCVIDNDTIIPVKNWTHTGIIFLNNNFTGGKLIYPNQGCIFAPTIGTLIIAPAGSKYTHYVEPVISGERFTLVFRFIEKENTV